VPEWVLEQALNIMGDRPQLDPNGTHFFNVVQTNPKKNF
jgi:hypothetical protein